MIHIEKNRVSVFVEVPSLLLVKSEGYATTPFDIDIGWFTWEAVGDVQEVAIIPKLLKNRVNWEALDEEDAKKLEYEPMSMDRQKRV